MPEITALMSRSKEKIIYSATQPHMSVQEAPQLSYRNLGPHAERERFARASLRRGADLIGNGKRLVGAVEELDGHEDHLLVAEIFQVVDLVLAGAVGLVAGLARLIAVFDRGAVVDMLAAAPAGDRGPEIVE